MKLFRTQKPTKQPPPSSNAPRSPPPLSADTSSIRGGGDLSSRIEPYTFGSPSPPPPSGTPIHSALQSHRQGHQQHGSNTAGINMTTNTGMTGDGMSRRHSMRARPSQEDPWVVVNTNANGGDPIESRSSSIASLMQPSLGATGATAPFISTHFLHQQQQREGSNNNLGNGNGSNTTLSSPSPIAPSQSRSPQPTTMKQQRPPPTSTTPQPTSQQQVQQQPQQPLAQSPPKMNGQPYQPDLTPQDAMYANGNMYMGNLQGQVPREGSIHSQQDKSWTRGLFGGATTGREKEANAELMRMIGFLTAAAPDDWNLVLEVCERSSANESAAKEAARALRREFKYGEPSAQLSAARLWAIMLQNATDTFILQTASRKFLENLEEVINSETTSPVVRERLLDVLASAAYVYGKKPGKEGFSSTWRKVRPSWKPAEGVPFDQEDGLFESAFPRRAGAAAAVGGGGGAVAPGVAQGVAAMTVPQLAQTQPPPLTYRDEIVNRTRRDRDRDRDKYLAQLAQQRAYEAAQQQPYRAAAAPAVPGRKDRGIIPPEEDMRRLLQECDVARNNAQVLSQALPFATPNTLGSDPVIQEFHTKCRASQELIVAQIPWASAGAERSRVAAANSAARRAAKDSGSDGAVNGKLTKNKHPAPGQNGANPPTDLTKEEKLLAALLTANQELVEVFRIYEELEKLAFDEMEEREVAKRSKAETRLDRTQIQYITPDGSLHMEPPTSQGASSSRSASPAIPPASSRTTSSASVPINSVSPAPSVPAKGLGRDLPHPPHPSTDHLSAPGSNAPSLPPSPAGYQHSHSHSQQSSVPPSPLPPPQQQQPQVSPQVPPSQPYHAHHASNQSLSGHTTLNLPPAAPHGPRQPAGSATTTRSRTPSPDRNGNFTPSHTPPTTAHAHAAHAAPNPADYGPPAHPPPQFTRGGVTGPVPALSVAGPPPGLTRVDVEAARRYSSEEEDLMTPIRPSDKAKGKRRAIVEDAPDEAELERREEAELEEAYMRSTAPPPEGDETPTRAVYYVYDAAAERAKELDRLEREEVEQERLRRLQRSSVQRVPGMGGGSGGGSVGAMNAAAAKSPA